MPPSRSRSKSQRSCPRWFRYVPLGLFVLVFVAYNSKMTSLLTDEGLIANEKDTNSQSNSNTHKSKPSSQQQQSTTSTSTSVFAKTYPPRLSLEEYRSSMTSKCSTALSSLSSTLALASEIPGVILDPLMSLGPEELRPEESPPEGGCNYLYLDFGANRGDSVARMSDAGRIGCTNGQGKVIVPPPRLDPEKIKLVERERRNNNWFDGLESRLRGILESSNLSSDQFCVRAYEGNPHFNEQLDNMSVYLNNESPRTLRHVKFHTETVGAGFDGPTKLYLDTVNPEHHFWGSSIVSSHKDAQASGGVSVDVVGVTLSSIFKEILPEKGGGMVIIKMDIEGGEYPMLAEAAGSGVICDYISRGYEVRWMIEFHYNSLRGAKGFEAEKGAHQKNKKILEGCGVVFSNAPAIWA